MTWRAAQLRSSAVDDESDVTCVPKRARRGRSSWFASDPNHSFSDGLFFLLLTDFLALRTDIAARLTRLRPARASSEFLWRPGLDRSQERLRFPRVPLVASSFTELAPAVSSDGRWMAYSSTETGGTEVFVVPFPNAGDAKWHRA